MEKLGRAVSGKTMAGQEALDQGRRGRAQIPHGSLDNWNAKRPRLQLYRSVTPTPKPMSMAQYTLLS